MGLLSDMYQDIMQDLENIKNSINNRYTDSGEDIEQLSEMQIGNINNGISNITVINTNDANATASDVVSGKYGFAKKARVEGNIPVLQGREYTPTSSDQFINAKQYTEGDQIVKGDPDLVPENIKEGIKIFNVTGTLKSTGTSIPDTNATSADVLVNKNGYVKDKGLINGSLSDQKGQDVLGTASGSNSNVKVSPTPNGVYDTNSTISVPAKDIANALGIKPNDILKGTTILGIEGTYDPEKEEQEKEEQEKEEEEKEKEKEKEEELLPFEPEDEEPRLPDVPEPQDPEKPIPPEPNYPPKPDPEEEPDEPGPDNPDDPNPDDPDEPDDKDKDKDDWKHDDDSFDDDGKQKEKDKEKDPFKDIEVDKDTDNDGNPDLNIDTDGDGKPDLNIDTDGDGIPDLNVDTDGDGKPDLNIDVDGDGKPDLNIDTNNDGKPDLNIDVDGDGEPDINVDLDGDGKPDLNIDVDGDGHADLNIDTDCDWLPNINIDSDGDGVADWNIDDNCDEIPDRNLLNQDTDGDGKPDLNVDVDGDGIPDYNIDTDGDGIPDVNKKDIHNNENNEMTDIDVDNDGEKDTNIDTDNDGLPNENIDKENEDDEGPRGKGDYIIMHSFPYDRKWTKKTIYGGWDSEIHDTFAKVDEYLTVAKNKNDKTIVEDKVQNVPARNTWPKNTYFIAGVIEEDHVTFVCSDFIQKGTSIKTILPEGIAEYRDGSDIPISVHFNFDNISLFHKYTYPKDHEAIVKNNFEFKEDTRMGAFVDSTYYSSIFPFKFIKKEDGTSYFERYFMGEIIDDVNKEEEEDDTDLYYKVIEYNSYQITRRGNDAGMEYFHNYMWSGHYYNEAQDGFHEEVLDYDIKEFEDAMSPGYSPYFGTAEPGLISLEQWYDKLPGESENCLRWIYDVDLKDLVVEYLRVEYKGNKIRMKRPILDINTGKKVSIDKLRKIRFVGGDYGLTQIGYDPDPYGINGEDIKAYKLTFSWFPLTDLIDLEQYIKDFGDEVEEEEKKEDPVYHSFEFGNIPYSSEYISYIRKGGATWWCPAGDCRFRYFRDGAGYSYIKQTGQGRQLNFILPSRYKTLDEEEANKELEELQKELDDIEKNADAESEIEYYLCPANDAGYVKYKNAIGDDKYKCFGTEIDRKNPDMYQLHTTYFGDLLTWQHPFKKVTKEEFFKVAGNLVENVQEGLSENEKKPKNNGLSKEERKKYYVGINNRNEDGNVWCCTQCGAISTGTHRLPAGLKDAVQASHPSWTEISIKQYKQKYNTWLNPNIYTCGTEAPPDPYLEDGDDEEENGNTEQTEELYGFAAIFTNVMDYRTVLSNCGLIITNRRGYKLTVGNGTHGRGEGNDTRFDSDGNIIGGEGTDVEKEQNKQDDYENILEKDKQKHDDKYTDDGPGSGYQDDEDGTARDKQMGGGGRAIIGPGVDPKDVIDKMPEDISDKDKNPTIGNGTDPDDSDSEINHGEYDTMDVDGETVYVPNPVLQHQYSDQKIINGNTIILPGREQYQDKNYKEEGLYKEDIVKWKRQ